MAYLELRKVSFAYYTQNSKTSILEDASFIFPNIGLVCIEGESGSGKSTVLNLLANYIKPNKGNIVKNYNDEEVGFVFQDFHLIDHLNVIENILLPKIVNGSLKKDGYNQAKKLLSTINLSNLENRKISELSYGQQARISLVRGLIGNKKVLLLDEPTANLDVENSIQIMEIIKEISKTKLVILVTHNKSLSQKYSDYIVHIENKKLICNKIIQNRESNKILTKKQLAKVKLKESLFLAYSFFKTRILKVSLSLVFISICFSIVSVLVNLSFNSKSQLQTYLSNNFDYNLLEIQEKKEYELDNQEMSLIKMDKLSFESENILKSYFPDIEIYLTLEYFIPGVNYIKSNSEYIDEKIAVYGDVPVCPMTLIGGTATSLAALEYRVEPYDPKVIHHSILTVEQIGVWAEKLLSMQQSERLLLKGMDKKRADILGGGALLLYEILRKIQAEKVSVSEADNTEGYLMKKLRENQNESRD